MLVSGRKVVYFCLLLIIPFLLWIIRSQDIYLITFLSILLAYLVSRYWTIMLFLTDILEVILIYLTLSLLFSKIGLEKLFPANVLLTIILMYLFLLLFKQYDRSRLYLTRGNTKGTIGIIILVSLLSIFSLSIWFILQKSNPYARFIPNLPIPLLISLGIGFAIINAFHEEGIFRSILLAHFSCEIGVGWAIFLQAIWFSCLHYQSGFPSGIIGIGLTLVFGLMMGYIVHRTRGLLVPIIIHALADFGIFLLVIFRMKNLI